MTFLILLGLVLSLCLPTPSIAEVANANANNHTLSGAQLDCKPPPEPSPGTMKRTELIDINGDGKTCPEGLVASDPQHKAWSGWTCFNGDWVGNKVLKGANDGKCCFSSTQHVFLHSVNQGATHLKAKYPFDGRTCCTEGETAGEWKKGQCFYQGSSLSIERPDWVRACCWDKMTQDFSLHLKQPVPLSDCTVQQWINSTQPSDACGGTLNVKIWVKQAQVFASRVDILVNVHTDCRVFHPSGATRLWVNFNRQFTDSGDIHLPVTEVGPTVIVTFQSKVNDNRTIELHGHVTGTGVISSLDERFQQTIDNDDIKKFLKLFPLC